MKREQALIEAQRVVSRRKLMLEYSQIWDARLPERKGAYEWQVEFHGAGKDHLERMLIKANQVGGTTCAACEVAIHAIGIYPEWWTGVRYDKPIRAWVGSESSEASRDIPQLALLGEEGNHGTGWIPGRYLIPGSIRYRQAGVTEVVDTIRTSHISGGESLIRFKTYEQGRKKWMGTVRELIWLDEEPPMDIYTEALTRITNAKNGRMLVTFTPLSGPTQVVQHFLEAKSDSIFIKNVSWEDAPHLDENRKKELLESYPEHERATRTRGEPMVGTGLVFPLSEDDIRCDPFIIPDYYYRINGLDFGIDHPFACAKCAWDKDNDIFYVYGGLKIRGKTPVYHAEGIHAGGDKWIPNAWPHDGMQRDKGKSGEVLKNQYRSAGVFMLKESANYDGPMHERPDRESLEPALIEMYEWMLTGRFKVFASVTEWFQEKRLYHRKDGKVVAQNDDIISASRYAFIMRRFARHRPVGKPVSKAPKRPILGGQQWRRTA